MNKTVLVASLALSLTLSGAGKIANAHQSMKSQVDHEISHQEIGSAGAALVAGPPTLVNTTTADYQFLKASSALDDGGYLLVWETTTTNPSDGARYYLQRFDNEGKKVGGETRLPLTVRDGSIAVLTNGDIVVGYRDARDAQGKIINTPYAASGAFIQKFDASGTQVLRETAVASTFGTPNAYGYVSVVPLVEGKFVVHWISESHVSNTVRHNFSAQSYDSEGERTASRIVLSTDNFPLTRPFDYSIQAAPDGGFVLYKSTTDLLNASGCFGSRSEPRVVSVFYYDENQVSKQILAPTHCAILLPLQGDRYMVFGVNPSGLYSQLIDGNGQLIGPQKPIAARTPFRDPELTIFTGRTMLADGSYMLFWFDGSGNDKAQRYSSNGDPIGEVVSVAPASRQILPLTGGDVILAWTASNENTNNLTDVYAQRLSDPDEKKNAHKHRRLKSCLEQVKGMKGHSRTMSKAECLVNSKGR